ncbi:C-terminal binding protein [Conexibacter woesei]|uniref:D-isomer specific 2-hydroxyacid dehydrogenase NAD-binding protein n=1 Tax=Conexibacter woesei (strain DSM 14684 / CCUG 47730 / CIP 108061 / JCM 11494 / NBRC 100937 / ID131577) TaxID=469383 RepID=D3F8A2_CONWI|nr:C-terminal binding protein [Conexibacter woesei]ADB48972.1 D-isomer specific 2-hydroxyacid dehydrogenase NAD-binding protein [Conexibacter woesei DSM 14684]
MVLVTPHKFEDLSVEHEVLAPTGARIVEAGSPAEFRQRAPEADVLLVNAVAPIDSALIATLTRCKAIVRYGAGVDNVDVASAAAAGIQVANVLDASVEEVANHALALALALLRRLRPVHDATARGEWPTAAVHGTRRLSALTCGVVGVGRIGTATAARFEALGLRVVASDPVVTDAPWPLLPLADLLAQADVVSLHLPLTDGTRHLLGAAELEAMRPGAILVNVSRGGLVDEAALARQLQRGALGGAGLDVFEDEPIPATHPLCSSPGALLTPHIAWYTEEAARDVQRKAAQEAARVLTGRPLLSPVT